MTEQVKMELAPEWEEHLKEIARKLPEALILHTALFFHFLNGSETDVQLDTQLMARLLRRRVLEKELDALGYSLNLHVRRMRHHGKPVDRELNNGTNG